MFVKKIILIVIIILSVIGVFLYTRGLIYINHGIPIINTQDFWESISDIDLFSKKNTPIRDKKSCEEIGGTWGPAGLYPEEVCHSIPMADYGKKCTDSDQCDGMCIAEEPEAFSGTGVCSKYGTTYGCVNEVMGGRVIVSCID